MDDDGDDRHAGRYRQHKRPFLEGTQRIRVSPRPLRKDDDRVAATDSVGSQVIRAKGCFPIFSLDLDHADGAHAAAEDRHFEQLGLGDELVARQNLGERRNVEPADVVRGEDVGFLWPQVVSAVNPHLDADRPQHQARPPPRRLVVHSVRFVFHAEQRGDDHCQSENGRPEQSCDVEQNCPKKRNQRYRKWSYPAGVLTCCPPWRTSTPGFPATTRPTSVSSSANSALKLFTSMAGAVTTISYSSPALAASIGETSSKRGIRSASISMRTLLAAATCPRSAARPSEMSIADVAPRAARPIAASIRGMGCANRARSLPVGTFPACQARTAAAGPPRMPVT